MTPAEIKQVRRSWGMTQAELGAMLDTDPNTVRRMEMDPERASFRRPAPRMVRLLRAYASGYRPPDWPECKRS